MFDTLSDRLRKTLAGLTGRGRVTEADVDAAMREVRLALLEADVNFKVVKDFVARVRERAIGAEVLESLTAGQQVVKIVNDELTALLSAGDRTFKLVGNPAVVALVGLQGSGKTTSAAKLAKFVVKQGRSPLLIAADPYRPAAADQLETLGKGLDIAVYRAPVGTPTVDIARQGIEHAKRIGRDVVIIDTAGRLTIDDALMDEIRAVSDATKPVETLLVVDAMTAGLPLRWKVRSPADRSATSSSLTIFTICWPADRLSRISPPMARSRTRATKSLTTLKLTSASRSARRTSRIAASTSASLIRPRPVRVPRVLRRRSLRVSNMVRVRTPSGWCDRCGSVLSTAEAGGARILTRRGALSVPQGCPSRPERWSLPPRALESAASV